MNKLQVKETRKELLKFANNSGHQTDEDLLAAYNRIFGTSIKTLTEAEFKELAYCANFFVLEEHNKRKDAIAEFVIKSQNLPFYTELIRTKGFFFALFIKLMSDIVSAKITV